MASETTDARVVWIKALTLRKPIRLKANIGNAGLALRSNLGPRSMAVAAKVGNIFRGSTLQMKGLAGQLLGSKLKPRLVGKMLRKISMAVSALYTGNHGLQGKVLPGDSVG